VLKMSEDEKKKLEDEFDREIEESEKYIAEQKKKDAKTRALLSKVDEDLKAFQLEKTEKELDKQISILQKTKTVQDSEIEVLKNEAQIAEFKKKLKLPNSTDGRRKTIHETRKLILNKQRELQTQKTGEDPEPKFLGKSEDHKSDVYEIYKKCGNCSKVFKTFKNETFCSSSCREQWVKTKLPELPLIQEEHAELNHESWDWERVGSEKSDSLGEYGIFKKVFKDKVKDSHESDTSS